MTYLADTHAVIWFLSGSDRLSGPAREAIERESSEVRVSAASAWEITTKHRLGKLQGIDASVARNVERAIVAHGFSPLPISFAHAELAGRLSGTHKDPFDRMLMAQSLADNLVLISNETAFDGFGVRRLW